jgi:hypothetical protein
VSARATGHADVAPTVIGMPPDRFVERGHTVEWPVRRLRGDHVTGFACAALLDPFRQRHVVTDAFRIGPLARVDVPLTIPDDWPEGLGQAVIVVTAGGEMSFLDFDVFVRSRERAGRGADAPSRSAKRELVDRPVDVNVARIEAR